MKYSAMRIFALLAVVMFVLLPCSAQQAAHVFTYGADLTDQAPYGKQSNEAASAAAAKVLSAFPDIRIAQSMMTFGNPKPIEPSPGVYDYSGLDARIKFITAAGVTPMITVLSTPKWMQEPCPSKPNVAHPSAAHIADYADMVAHVAQRYTQVKYFIIWNEMKCYTAPAPKQWDPEGYTAMYNAVYTAIKKVRPDAIIGGPYAIMSATIAPYKNPAELHGPWGHLNQTSMDVLTYWIKHNVGADFICIDGATAVAKDDDSSFTDPVTASGVYAAVTAWIKARTTLPLWYIESHIQSDKGGWTEPQQAAARVATLAIMDDAGVTVGMQWNPESGAHDMGLWTATNSPGGGQPTPLAEALHRALPILEAGIKLVPGQPKGVVVGVGPAGSLAVNTMNVPLTATLNGKPLQLGPAQVFVAAATAVKP